MKTRCYNPKTERYERYGGRGITVCDEWRESFEAFFRDMGPRPSPDHSIEREDNDGPYAPYNCHWATGFDQRRNRSDNHLLTFNGRTQILTDWERETGIGGPTIRRRLKLGWGVERALTTPVRGYAGRKARSVAHAS